MMRWKSWESKKIKYNLWYRKEHSKIFTLLWNILQEKSMRLVPLPNQKGEDLLLDVGCGDGRYLVSSTNNKGFFSIGIDPNNEVSLVPAKKKIRQAGLDPFLIKSVGESIPIQRSIISVVLCNSALDHTLDPEKVLKEIYGTLRENGTLVVWQGVYRSVHSSHKTAEYETHLRTFTANDLVGMLNNSGFSITSSIFLGCDLVPYSEANKSILSKIPKFLNRALPILLKIYLLSGKLLPTHASIVMLQLKKTRTQIE